MNKNICILSYGIETGLIIKDDLSSILNHDVFISTFSTNDTPNNINNYDLVIFTSNIVSTYILSVYVITTNHITLNRIINLKNINKLIELQRGKEVLLVSSHKDNCDIVINQLNACGIDHIIYNPYYENIDTYKQLDTAITAGELYLVPKCVKNTIDIGSRQIDVISMVEILSILGILDEYRSTLSSHFYKTKFIEPTKDIIIKSDEIIKTKNILRNILDSKDEGIIYTNSENYIIELNTKAINILNIKKENIIGENFYELFDCPDQDIAIINNQEIWISEKNINNENDINKVITIDLIDNIKTKDEKIRIKKNSSVLKAKYTFSDILGNSVKNKETIDLAKKISKSDSTVLLQGETGTGKELFSQAIHNNSRRKDYPFIAINFSSIPDSLIESELFGYVDGAFTGAKKSGKEGLLKKAHKGTVLLDEIGDIPYHLQVKLLRVLQEREITPIGSTEIIPLDLRVIAATNKDLFLEVERKNFRKDLFYRLNVMPIYTVPLRERRDDIVIFISSYLKKFGYNHEYATFFDNGALQYLINYDWPGNIRELINVIEYLINIKDKNKKILIDNLPKYILKNDINNTTFLDEYPESIWVLEKIYDSNGIGRKKLCSMSTQENINIGEGRLRSILYKLQEENYISINRGIYGNKISVKGISFLKKINSRVTVKTT